MKSIFYTGMGRSGTKFLSRLFDHIPNATARHEEVGDRNFWLLSWYLKNTDYSLMYLKNERSRIEPTIENEYFIDVNSYLPYAVKQVQAVFETNDVLHVVRDPRAVVRSIYARRDVNALNIMPTQSDELKDWMDGDNFTRICWSWTNTTKQLINNGLEPIKFELLTSDYTYFCDKILNSYNFDISKVEWENASQKPVNRTRNSLFRYLYSQIKRKHYVKKTLPAFSSWPNELKDRLIKICGPTMQAAGYDPSI